MRNLKLLAFTSIIVFVTFFANPIWAAAERASVLLQETDLSPGGNAADIHVGLGGDLFIIDRADELWRVDPETWDYDKYINITGADLIDLVQVSGDEIWWTAPDTTFGNLNLDTNAVQSWDLPYEDLNLNSVVFNEGLLWLAPFYGPSHGLFSFDVSPTSYELCLFETSINASDLILHDGLLWLIDWSKESLMSMDPTTGHLVMFSDSEWDILSYNANLQTDGNLLWWTEDNENGKILSFDPVTFEATTYQLPSGEQPRNLILREGEVWYTNAQGSIGRISPDFADKTTKILSEVVIKEVITPDCDNLGAPTSSISSKDFGTFGWDAVEGTIMTPSTGLQTHSLPDEAEPFGIASTGDEIWVSDPGRQKLIRMAVSDDQDDRYYTFLPLVIK